MNLKVQTSDERLAAMHKPAVETVEQFTLDRQDWLVVSAGFEDRALAVLLSAISTNASFSVLLITYEPHYSENRAGAIREACRQNRIQWCEAVYNRQQPMGFGDVIVGLLSNCTGRICLDVSAMSRILIVQLLVALGASPMGLASSVIAYAEAREYSPSRADADTMLGRCGTDPTFAIYFLSNGVYEVAILPELASFAPVGSQTRLIAFPSLDAHQLTALRAEIQPSRMSLIEGMPPDPRNAWRRELVAAVNGLDSMQDAERFVTSTLDYSETLSCLLGIYSRRSGLERLVISPTGSKMQAVAVGILRSFVQDVQIVYPTPEEFIRPSTYTIGIGPMHQVSLKSIADFV